MLCIEHEVKFKQFTSIAPNSSRPHEVFFKRPRRTSATGEIRLGDGNIWSKQVGHVYPPGAVLLGSADSRSFKQDQWNTSGKKESHKKISHCWAFVVFMSIMELRLNIFTYDSMSDECIRPTPGNFCTMHMMNRNRYLLTIEYTIELYTEKMNRNGRS